jgi:hypothetical protein
MGLRTWMGLKKRRGRPRPPASPESSDNPRPLETSPTYPRGPTYWEGRQKLRYYSAVRELCAQVAPGAQSVLDVGSNACPQLEWFPKATRRVSVDLVAPYCTDDVEGLTCDFLTYQPDRRFDLAICLQVLEHIEAPAPFARHLLSVAHDVVISVPYLWPVGACHWHCQDPVDEAKVRAWFGREPDRAVVISEERQSLISRRLICHFNQAGNSVRMSA